MWQEHRACRCSRNPRESEKQRSKLRSTGVRSVVEPSLLGLAARCSAHRRGVMAQVVRDEALDEPVTVVVAGLHAQFERLARRAACRLEALRLQLAVKEPVRVALVDEDRAGKAVLAYQFAGVVRIPCQRIVAEVAWQRLLPPRN